MHAWKRFLTATQSPDFALGEITCNDPGHPVMAVRLETNNLNDAAVSWIDGGRFGTHLDTFVRSRYSDDLDEGEATVMLPSDECNSRFAEICGR